MCSDRQTDRVQSNPLSACAPKVINTQRVNITLVVKCTKTSLPKISIDCDWWNRINGTFSFTFSGWALSAVLLYPSTEKVLVVIAVMNTITTNYNTTQRSQRWHGNLPAHNREPGHSLRLIGRWLAQNFPNNSQHFEYSLLILGVHSQRGLQ